MRRVLVRHTSKLHTAQQLWEIIYRIQDYPKWLKYCARITQLDAREGGSYTDITTLLWVPVKVYHTITVFRPPTDARYDLPLPLGGTMRQTFQVRQRADAAEISLEVVFDLGNFFYNLLVGPILEWRIRRMLTGPLPAPGFFND